MLRQVSVPSIRMLHANAKSLDYGWLIVNSHQRVASTYTPSMTENNAIKKVGLQRFRNISITKHEFKFMGLDL